MKTWHKLMMNRFFSIYNSSRDNCRHLLMDISSKDFTFPSSIIENQEWLIIALIIYQLPWRSTSGLSKVGILDDIWVTLRLPGPNIEIQFIWGLCLSRFEIINHEWNVNNKVSQVVIMMRGAMEQGQVNCMASMASVVDEARAHLVEPKETVFFDPFKNMSGKMSLKNIRV